LVKAVRSFSLSLDLQNLMIGRLDEIHPDAERSPFWASHYRTDNHLRHRALWNSHRLGVDRDIWTNILESIPLTLTRPEEHDGLIASWHIFCRHRAARQPNSVVHRTQLGPCWYGYDNHLSPIHQHSPRLVHCLDRRHRDVSMELCQSSHNFHHVCAPFQCQSTPLSPFLYLPHRSVISGWGIFLAPMAGIVISDYFVVHRRELHLDDLYIGNHTSAYWYTAGFNWRAPIAWYISSPLLPPCLSPCDLSLAPNSLTPSILCLLCRVRIG
jgi:Permease for cytosine/purines, uracil, thiamine, allantoin